MHLRELVAHFLERLALGGDRRALTLKLSLTRPLRVRQTDDPPRHLVWLPAHHPEQRPRPVKRVRQRRLATLRLAARGAGRRGGVRARCRHGERSRERSRERESLALLGGECVTPVGRRLHRLQIKQIERPQQDRNALVYRAIESSQPMAHLRRGARDEITPRSRRDHAEIASSRCAASLLEVLAAPASQVRVVMYQ